MRSVRTIWRRTGAIVAATVTAVAVAALALSGGAHATAHRQTYLQLNMCGNACNRGGLQVVANLEAFIDERRPFAVTLNEVCESQYDKLRADLVLYHGRFDPTGPTCHNGDRYGNAVLVRTSNVSLVGSWQLPNPAADETRRLMCLRTLLPGAPPLLVCVTHISNVWANITAQVSAVAGVLNELTVTNAVLLGGDFNTDPADARMDPLYSTCYSSGTGVFHEADSPGCANRTVTNKKVGADVVNEHTCQRHKFDYIFLSDAHWSSATADATDAANGLSDHDALWATTILSG